MSKKRIISEIWLCKYHRKICTRKLFTSKFNFNFKRSLFKATAILLPLLGLTWLFGLLVVDGNSLVFAWIFTLLNSFQVNYLF